MTGANRHRPNPASPSPDRVKLRFAGGLFGLLIATLALRAAVPPELVTPALATLLFALAAGAALAAAAMHDRLNRASWLDAAGLLAYAGAAVSILIEPEQFVNLENLVPYGNSTDAID